MNQDTQIKYWLSSAEHDLSSAEALFAAEKFDWCLFLGHLVLEKTLKAVWSKRKQTIPPKSHNLLMLANDSITLSDQQKEFLEQVNDFHIEARYPDEKQTFYRICTKEFATTQFIQIKELFQWLKLQIQ